MLTALDPPEKKQFLEELIYVVFTTRRNKGHNYLPSPDDYETKEMWDIVGKLKDAFTV